jgi:AcrR family transcriptional regulator
MSNLGEPRFIQYVPETQKEERFRRVARAVIEIMLQRRISDITVSAVARKAGVSRPWIYKYFGKEISSLVDFTVREFGSAFMELDEQVVRFEGVDAWRTHVMERTRKSLDDVETAPWVISLYFRYRHDVGQVGEAMRDLEARHNDKFRQSIPPTLVGRRGRPATDRFVEVFGALRSGAYYRWADPKVRKRVGKQAMLDDLLVLVDHFLR